MGSDRNSHVRLTACREIEAHIGRSRGHFFLQPTPQADGIYHNNEYISTSVWIKSGDRTRIGDEIVEYLISGDLITIRVLRSEDVPLNSTVTDIQPKPNVPNSPLPKVSEKAANSKKSPKIRYILGSLLLILLAAASFLLTARSVDIIITPSPDTFSLSGFPPPIKIRERYLALPFSYTLTAHLDGYSTLEESIKVSSNRVNRFEYLLQKLPGIVDILTRDTPDAEVFIDGKSMGHTPLTNLQVEAGEHLLRVNKPRYLPLEKKLLIHGMTNRQSFELNLQPGWADVHLSSEPPGALVHEGEVEHGITPITMQLMAGKHNLLLSMNDFSPERLKLDAVAGQDLRPAPVKLNPSPATLHLTSDPVGATVVIDQSYQGRTPLTMSISSGMEHLIKLELAGRKSKVHALTLGPNQIHNLKLSLEAEYGIIFLITEPPDAQLAIDGKKHSNTIGRLRLPVGSHTFEVKAKGFKTARRTITPSKEYDQQIEIKLVPKNAQPSVIVAPNTVTAPGKIKLIRFGPAKFTMGSSRREAGRRANEVQRNVQITHPFYLAVNEVSNQEFRKFKPDHSSGNFRGHSLDSNNSPAVNLSWEDAARYCNWLSLQEGLKPFYVEKNKTMVTAQPITNGYRLPFEAEWAYSARMAGRQQVARYGWVGNYPPQKKTGNYGDLSARQLLNVTVSGYNDGFSVSAPVGSFPPNIAGIFDLDGNVSEWCHDFYSPTVNGSASLLTDPVGPSTGTHHMVRGASWRDATITELRLSYRGYSRSPMDDIGFRVARYAE